MRNKDASLRRHAVEMLKTLADGAKPDADVLVAYGQILYQEKQTDRAAEVYRRAIKLKPDEPVAMNNLAMIDAETGQNLPEALAMAKKAVELKPKAATFYDSLATVQMKMNQPADAVATLKKAIEVDPGEATWKLNLADLQVQSGHRADALKTVQQIENSVADPSLLPATVQARIQKIRSGSVDRQTAVGAR
jgi:Flp pilus assembly protein TadD